MKKTGNAYGVIKVFKESMLIRLLLTYLIDFTLNTTPPPAHKPLPKHPEAVDMA